MKKKADICVIIPVHIKTKVNEFLDSLSSILNQTLSASEIIIIVDGPIESELKIEIEKKSIEEDIIVPIYLKNNVGPGKARDIAIRSTSKKYIALMDSDDISKVDRLEKQYQTILSSKSDLCGGGIIEFYVKNNKIHYKKERKVPIQKSDIDKVLKIKSPFNNVTALFTKESYISVGGFPHIRTSEDYLLWAKYKASNKNYCNLREVLVEVRTDEEMYYRRGGVKVARNDFIVQKYMFQNDITSFFEYIRNLIIYLGLRFSPSFLLKLLYEKILR